MLWCRFLRLFLRSRADPRVLSHATLFHVLLRTPVHELRVVCWLLHQVVQSSVVPAVFVANLPWSALAEGLSMDAIVLRVLLRLLGCSPAKAWSSDAPVRPRLSVLTPAAVPAAWLRVLWSAGTSRRSHVLID